MRYVTDISISLSFSSIILHSPFRAIILSTGGSAPFGSWSPPISKYLDSLAQVYALDNDETIKTRPEVPEVNPPKYPIGRDIWDQEADWQTYKKSRINWNYFRNFPGMSQKLQKFISSRTGDIPILTYFQ